MSEANAIIRLLLAHLPDSESQGEDWDWCWDELTDLSQENVKAARKKASRYLEAQDE